MDGASVLEAGVKLLGQGRSTEERLFIAFNKAVFRNGKSISISAQAYDLSDSILGLKGSRVGDRALKLAASSGLYFISGMASGLQAPIYNESGKIQTPSASDAALNGVSQAASEQAKSYMEDIKNRAPIIEVKSGTVFTITFDGGK
jgi:type IV secretory pathway VirB10-like protein